ncbi:MAG: CRISPR-associated endonuclease Cas1 [Acidipropionibacterium sp.]|jgi:CRISPR-associated protein Cas1|nr:CRISPR-associated endonuclease Cas1 [Acidipropionibacterium sp.]
MNTLQQALAQPSTLERAWSGVAGTNDLSNSAALRSYAGRLDDNLAALLVLLLDQAYAPGAYHGVLVGNGGKRRQLWVPDIDQRIVERALVDLFDARIDGFLSARSCGFRRGLGVREAVKYLMEACEAGATHVALVDIHSCFDFVPRRATLAELQALADDSSVGWLLERLDTAITSLPGMSGAGVPQGAPLSPMLANVALNPIDDTLTSAGLDFARYADDIAVPCAGEAEAKAATKLVREALEEHGFRAAPEKTRVERLTAGFTWLGTELEAEAPAALGGEPVRPQRPSLYVGGPGRYINVRKGRVRVCRDDKEEASVPANRVGQLVTFGPVGVSAGLRQWSLNSGVPVQVLSMRGNYLGTMHPAHTNHVSRRMAQYDAARSPRALEIAQSIVRGKILNCRALALRYGTGPEIGRASSRLRSAARRVTGAATRDELMGLEAGAAKDYWACFGSLLPEGTTFSSRNRRPPKDVVNSALSFGYAILQGECCGALVGAGLDPACSVLHALNDNRASLSLDLMEEFRPVLVDTVVLDCFRRGMLSDTDGRPVDNDGVYLTEAGKRTFLNRYERRMQTQFTHPVTRKRITWRAGIHAQALALATSFSCDDMYRAVSWR